MMDVNNNELVSPGVIKELAKQFGQQHPEVKRFTSVPKKLDHAAEVKLAGENRAIVSKTSGGKLSKWAAGKRKSKRKRQQQRKARRRNQ